MLLCRAQVMSSRPQPGGVACRVLPCRDLPQHPRTSVSLALLGGRARGGHPATVGDERISAWFGRYARSPWAARPALGRPRWPTIAARRAPISASNPLCNDHKSAVSLT